MQYLDFDLEIGDSDGLLYPVSVRAPAGQAEAKMRFPFGELELENALLKLQNALLNSVAGRRRHRHRMKRLCRSSGAFSSMRCWRARRAVSITRASARPPARAGDCGCACIFVPPGWPRCPGNISSTRARLPTTSASRATRLWCATSIWPSPSSH